VHPKKQIILARLMMNQVGLILILFMCKSKDLCSCKLRVKNMAQHIFAVSLLTSEKMCISGGNRIQMCISGNKTALVPKLLHKLHSII